MFKFQDIKINIKPVFPALIHSESYEGPCRVGDHADLTPEAEREKNKVMADREVWELCENVQSNVNILQPAYFERSDDFVVHENELQKLEPDIYDADLVLILGKGLRQEPATRIAYKYNKPVGQIGWVSTVDITANLRAHGYEGYAFMDYDHFNSFLELMRVRKAFYKTRMMVVTQGHSFPPRGVVSSIVNTDRLFDHLGVDYRMASASQLMEKMDTLPGKTRKEAERLTGMLVKDAQACHMKEKDVIPSVQFYLAVRELLEENEYNAFTIPCFEICATREMEKRRMMFCLAHSLLKDETIPSACEGDTNVLMAIALLMYLSGKSPFMGNPASHDKKSNILRIHHDVPGLQMKGFDERPAPYEIRNFTKGGWGATLRYDFNLDKGEPVTLARFNPQADKVLIATGAITGGDKFNAIGCSLAVDIELNDIGDFFEKQQDFGHHLAMVYGDYRKKIKELSRIMGINVTES